MNGNVNYGLMVHYLLPYIIPSQDDAKESKDIEEHFNLQKDGTEFLSKHNVANSDNDDTSSSNNDNNTSNDNNDDDTSNNTSSSNNNDDTSNNDNDTSKNDDDTSKNDDDTSNNDDTSCGNGGYDRVGTDLRKYQKIFHLDVFG